MIPKVFIDELIRKANIEQIVSSYVELVPIGAQRRGACPFCHSNNSTFNVTIDKNIFKCFRCGEGGNVIDFIKLIEKISFPEAVHLLAKKLDLEVPQTAD